MDVTVIVNGEEMTLDVTATIEDMDLQQLCKLEKVLGSDRTAALLGARGERVATGIAVLPTTLRAILYVKVQDLVPDVDLKLHDFTLDQETLISLGASDEDEVAEVVDLPMSLPDGTVVTGGSPEDPTEGAELG